MPRDRKLRKPPIPRQIEPEETPPPVDPAVALEQLWPVRHLGEQFEAVRRGLDGYTKQTDRLQAELDQWVPKLKECIADIDGIAQKQAALSADLGAFFEREWPRIARSLDGVADSLKQLGERMTRLEVSVQHVGNAQAEHAQQFGEHDARLKTLETASRDKRVISTERRRWFSLAHAVVAAGAAALTALGIHLFG